MRVFESDFLSVQAASNQPDYVRPVIGRGFNRSHMWAQELVAAGVSIHMRSLLGPDSPDEVAGFDKSARTVAAAFLDVIADRHSLMIEGEDPRNGTPLDTDLIDAGFAEARAQPLEVGEWRVEIWIAGVMGDPDVSMEYFGTVRKNVDGLRLHNTKTGSLDWYEPDSYMRVMVTPIGANAVHRKE